MARVALGISIGEQGSGCSDSKILMKFSRKCAYIVALVVAISCARGLNAADQLTLNLVVRDALQKRLEAGVVKQSQRQSIVKELFEQVGCSVKEQPIDKKMSNVICALKGDTASTIVVGAHYDFREEGQGIVDDWSGTAMLASLYEALKAAPRRHSYEFVAFASEEKGLVGSERFVKAASQDERDNMRAFVNLECLGLTPPKVWVRRSTPELVTHLGEISNAIHVLLQGVNVDNVGDDDTHSFLEKKIPVVSIHSVTAETWPILHSGRDNLKAIHMDDYEAAYKLIAFYLAYLDMKLP